MATRTSKSNKKVGRKSAAARAGVAELTSKEIAALKGADASFARKLDVSVAQLLSEARELIAAAGTPKRAAQLVAGSKLKAGFAEKLADARDVLDRAESIWSVTEAANATRDLKKVRAAAVALKRQAMAALRYLLREDEVVQAALDEIAEGTGDDDTISDLRKLAVLAKDHAGALAKAVEIKRLPKQPDRELVAHADKLHAARSDTTTAKHTTHEASGEVIDLRNRAFWALRKAMDDVRDAGRYVFSEDPRTLRHFRATTGRRKTPRKRKEE